MNTQNIYKKFDIKRRKKSILLCRSNLTIIEKLTSILMIKLANRITTQFLDRQNKATKEINNSINPLSVISDKERLTHARQKKES